VGNEFDIPDSAVPEDTASESHGNHKIVIPVGRSDELEQMLADIKPATIPSYEVDEEDVPPGRLLVPLQKEINQQVVDRGINTPARWDAKLVFDLALEIDDLPTILERYGLEEADITRLLRVPAFRRELAGMVRDIRENGVSFTSKARLQAEDYLQIVDEMVYAPDTPASVKTDLIKTTAKWAGFGQEKGDLNNNGSGKGSIEINIKF
jgi:hypothetical protein